MGISKIRKSKMMIDTVEGVKYVNETGSGLALNRGDVRNPICVGQARSNIVMKRSL